jgi:hypothetical protein
MTMYLPDQQHSSCCCNHDNEVASPRSASAGWANSTDRALFERLWKGTFRAILADQESKQIAPRLSRHGAPPNSCCCCCHHLIPPQLNAAPACAASAAAAIANLQIRVLAPKRSQCVVVRAANARTLRSVIRYDKSYRLHCKI